MKTVIDGKTYFHPAAVPASRDFYQTTKSASILRKYYARVAHGAGDKAQMKWKFARFNAGKNLGYAEAE
jgi:hypothetical protein